ncbi:MAG: outer membrane lipoprotein-sorting protein [Desulforhabdus sp.]|nr:outer membrane lipoprotein-sorting protein [Desulforhabdus sp.]
MKRNLLIVLCLLPVVVYSRSAAAQNAADIVQAAIEYYRGKASEAVVEMIIHRPDWERSMTIKARTKGQKQSIFFITAPPKDKGNGTLKVGREMWTYNPKVNRIIKLPPSMMSQSWMGSDFSNDDLAKSDSIVEDYTHTLEGTEAMEGKKVYVIKSLPKPAAPVVWGMQKLKIREDHVLLGQEFYDEEFELVKAMTGRQIVMMGGKLFPRIWTMQKAEARDEYTMLDYKELEFKDELPDHLFTTSSLRTAWR